MSDAFLNSKIALAEKEFNNFNFVGATKLWFFIFLKTRNKSHLLYLLLSSIKSHYFTILFSDNSFLKSYFDEELKNLFNIFTIKNFEINESIIIDVPIQDLPFEYLPFEDLYLKCINALTEKDFKKSLTCLISMFKTQSFFEILNLLICQRRFEILFHLSKCHSFFNLYYCKVKDLVNCEYLSLFYYISKTRSNEIEQLCLQFTDKKERPWFIKSQGILLPGCKLKKLISCCFLRDDSILIKNKKEISIKDI